MEVKLDLVKKYNVPGPRYTSYPTAVQFSSDFAREEALDIIKKNNVSSKRDLSLYFHIPFCDSLCYYCGCTTTITRKPEKLTSYLDALFLEIDLMKKNMHSDRKVVQQHYGGGTPTYLSPYHLQKLGEKINNTFNFSEDAERGCEMDPRELTREHIKALAFSGIKRASIGVQDFNEIVQKAVNRINPKEMVLEVIDNLRKENFSSINMDLIYGLPFQTVSTFEDTLNTVIAMRPNRLAIFNYAYIPWLKPHQKKIKESDLPAAEEKLLMLKMMIEKLSSEGYIYIGMDHFALADDELTIAQKEKRLQRNFQGYSTKAGADIYAFGMSSISQLEDAYFQNYKTLKDYYNSIESSNLAIEKGYLLSEEDKRRRLIISKLMCDMELNFENISKDLNLDFKSIYASELASLKEFEKDELLLIEKEKIKITSSGRLFLRNIAMTFDAYLKEGQGRFSKTI